MGEGEIDLFSLRDARMALELKQRVQSLASCQKVARREGDNIEFGVVFIQRMPDEDCENPENVMGV